MTQELKGETPTHKQEPKEYKTCSVCGSPPNKKLEHRSPPIPIFAQVYQSLSEPCILYKDFIEFHEKIVHFYKHKISIHEEKVKDEIRKKVWVLRQLLNEERITEPKKMITNDYILTVLDLLTTKNKGV